MVSLSVSVSSLCCNYEASWSRAIEVEVVTEVAAVHGAARAASAVGRHDGTRASIPSMSSTSGSEKGHGRA